MRAQIWPIEGLLSVPSLLFKEHCCTFLNKNVARKHFRRYYLGQVGNLYVATNLAQIITPYLAQIITPQNGILFAFSCFTKCAETPILQCLFEHQPKIA